MNRSNNESIGSTMNAIALVTRATRGLGLGLVQGAGAGAAALDVHATVSERNGCLSFPLAQGQAEVPRGSRNFVIAEA
jgi:hypothetical protein